MTFRTIKELNARVGTEPRAVIQSAPESSEKERFLHLLDNYSDALIRTCRPGLLTGSSLVFDPFSGQIRDALLLRPGSSVGIRLDRYSSKNAEFGVFHF